MPETRILLGVVGRPHGVRGLVHVHCYASDPASLAAYGPLTDEAGRRWTLEWRGAGVAALRDERGQSVADRTAAEKLVNVRLYVERERLPEPGEEEFYLADLIGLAAEAPDGSSLGTISAVHDYGAGASLEIGALLVPFTKACVPTVDMAGGRVVVCPPGEVVAVGPSPNPLPEGEGFSLLPLPTGEGRGEGPAAQ